MGDVSYRPLIEDMTWSYSRIGAFEDCPYKFFLRYIKEYKECDRFYASYGSFMHKLIENYYLGFMSKEEMLETFVTGFSTHVKGDRPKGTIVENYIRCGVDYLKSFEPFPYEMDAVEERIEFEIAGIKMVGVIDFRGHIGDDIYIVDNKSRNLKPRSGKGKPTKNDEELDLMLRQLYLYAAAVKQKYGRYPKALCFNCFKNGEFIVEPFDENACNDAIGWAVKTIEEIKDCDDFHPNLEYFLCTFLCGVSDECEYNEMVRQKGKMR